MAVDHGHRGEEYRERVEICLVKKVGEGEGEGEGESESGFGVVVDGRRWNGGRL